MNKQEYESLKKGDKLKIVSLEYTSVGDANFEVGEVVEFLGYHENSTSNNDLLIKQEGGNRWFISSKDLELVKDFEYKVGDEVVFTAYDDDREWETGYGGVIGEKYTVARIDHDGLICIKNELGRGFYVKASQINKSRKAEGLDGDEDLVNSPKHYATDPSGVECIQIKRKMSASAGDAFKYCWRVGKKWDDRQDLEKALWYINDAIEHDVPVWLDDDVDLETEALIRQVLKHRAGWQYMFINALYWSDLEEAKRAVEIGIKQIEDVVSK